MPPLFSTWSCLPVLSWLVFRAFRQVVSRANNGPERQVMRIFSASVALHTTRRAEYSMPTHLGAILPLKPRMIQRYRLVNWLLRPVRRKQLGNQTAFALDLPRRHLQLCQIPPGASRILCHLVCSIIQATKTLRISSTASFMLSTAPCAS